MEMRKLMEEFLIYLQTRNRSKYTIEGYGKDLRIFTRFLEERFRIREVSKVRDEHVEMYIRYLAGERKLQPRSQNRYVSAISSCICMR